MTLFPAIVLAYAVDQVIPYDDISQLYLFGAVLVSVALLATLLTLFQKMVLIRIEGRISYRAEAAFWDRMQRLPTKFLHSFAACDLAMRGTAFQTVRESIESLVVNGVVSIAFLTPAFVIAVLYDALLGTVAIIFGLLSLAIYGFIGMRQVAPQHRIHSHNTTSCRSSVSNNQWNIRSSA